MSEPALSWTPDATTYTDTANGAVTVFLDRGGYLAEARTSEYEAWTTWAATSGTADQQAIEGVYSDYAFTVWYDTNGFASVVAALGSPATWYPH